MSDFTLKVCDVNSLTLACHITVPQVGQNAVFPSSGREAPHVLHLPSVMAIASSNASGILLSWAQRQMRFQRAPPPAWTLTLQGTVLLQRINL